MFLLNLTLAIELIALGFGVAFLIWAYRTKGVGSALGKVIGFIISIGIVLLLVCTSFHAVKYAKGFHKGQSSAYIMKQQRMIGNLPPGLRQIRRPRQ